MTATPERSDVFHSFNLNAQKSPTAEQSDFLVSGEGEKSEQPNRQITFAACDVGPRYLRSTSFSPETPWVPEACGYLGFDYSGGYRIVDIFRGEDFLVVNIDSFKASGIVRVPLQPGTPARDPRRKLAGLIGIGKLFWADKGPVFFQSRKGLYSFSRSGEFRPERVTGPGDAEIRDSCLSASERAEGETPGEPFLFVLSGEKTLSWLGAESLSQPTEYEWNSLSLPSYCTSILSSREDDQTLVWAYSSPESWISVYIFSPAPGTFSLAARAKAQLGEGCRFRLREVPAGIQALYGPFCSFLELHENYPPKELKAGMLTARRNS